MNKQALTKIKKLFEMSDNEDLQQDYDLVMADYNRVIEFLDYYQNESLNKNESFVLMEIIVASYDDYLEIKSNDKVIENQIMKLINEDFENHKETVKYWSREEESFAEGWKITPFMKIIWENNN